MKTEREEEGMKGAEVEGQRCSARQRSAQERRRQAVSLQHKGEVDEQAVAWGSQMVHVSCTREVTESVESGREVGEGNPCEGTGEILEQQP